MNQQFSVEYLGIKPTRYNRLPNLNNNHYLNLSQELRTSRTKKNLAQQKLHALSNKKDDSNNYYNHTTIYNVKENKDISKTSIKQELSFSKYNELQTKLMVSDFKKKVDAFLKKNNQKSNLMSNTKIASSLKELELLQQIKNEELLNKSLCSNKYTVKTEKKSMKAMEIFILGNNKVVTKQVISSELIQSRLLKQMETFLKDDRFNYDLKMTTMIEQYAEIVNRIHEKAFTIKIPEKYIIQMSDYNEYYQIKEDTIENFLENKLEIIADQIIQEIQQSKRTTPKILSHKTSEIYEPIVQQQPTIYQIEDLIQTEPNIVHQQEIIKQESPQIEQIISDRKVSNKKSRQRKKNQQNKNERNQSEQSSLSEIMDQSLKNSAIKDNDDIRRRRKEKQKITDQAQIEEEEQDLIQKEIEKQKKQKIIKKLREFNQLFKPQMYSKRQSEDTILQIEEPILLAQPKQKVLKTLSLRPADDTLIMKEIYEIIRVKKQQLYEYQSEQRRKQEQAIENSIQNQNNIKQKPLNLIVNGKHISELKEAAELWDSKRNSPRSFTKQRQNQNNSTVVEQKQEEINVNEQINNMIEEQNNQANSQNLQDNNPDNSINYQQIINQKLISLEEKLNQQCQDIFDILLASEFVYDVKIDDYKIGKPHSNKINHPNFIFQQEQDEIVFTHQVLWRREIQQVIPKLNSVNKQMSVLINSEDEYIQDNQQIISEDEDEDKSDQNDDSKI